MALTDMYGNVREISRRMLADEIGYPRGMTGVKFNPKTGTYDTFAERAPIPRRRMAGGGVGREIVYDIPPPQGSDMNVQPPVMAQPVVQPVPVQQPAQVQQSSQQITVTNDGQRTGIASLFLNSPNQLRPKRPIVESTAPRVSGGATRFGQVTPIKVDGRSKGITRMGGQQFRVERTGGPVVRGVGGGYKKGARLVAVDPGAPPAAAVQPGLQQPAAQAPVPGAQQQDYDAELKRILGMPSPFEEPQA